jgi:hypothetical protein
MAHELGWLLYLLEFGSRALRNSDGVTTFPINIKQNINSFMVGINYRFGASDYTNY